MFARCERRAREQPKARRAMLDTECEHIHKRRAREQPEARQARLNRPRERNHERTAIEQAGARQSRLERLRERDHEHRAMEPVKEITKAQIIVTKHSPLPVGRYMYISLLEVLSYHPNTCIVPYQRTDKHLKDGAEEQKGLSLLCIMIVYICIACLHLHTFDI